MKRKLCLLALALSAVCMAGCSKNTETMALPTVNFSNEIGVASGRADFSTETPNISIGNIKSYVGEDIDYSSGVEVTNTDNIEDFQMWVDASQVDIYTAGNYEVVYRFVYDGNTIDKTIIVSIVEKEYEPSLEYTGDSEISEENGYIDNTGNESANRTENIQAGSESTTEATSINTTTNNNNTNNNNQEAVSSSVAAMPTTLTNTTKASAATTEKINQSTTKTNSTTTAKSTTAASNATQKTTREIITSTANGSITTSVSNLGYMSIELLSGTVVRIKCTSARYIVSTRTDTSTTTKNGVKYNVYKLIVTYNTGDEQVLETYEEKQ